MRISCRTPYMVLGTIHRSNLISVIYSGLTHSYRLKKGVEEDWAKTGERVKER